jgi:hypothetical protein
MAMAAATNTVMDRGTAMHDRRRAALEAVSASQSSDTLLCARRHWPSARVGSKGDISAELGLCPQFPRKRT